MITSKCQTNDRPELHRRSQAISLRSNDDEHNENIDNKKTVLAKDLRRYIMYIYRVWRPIKITF